MSIHNFFVVTASLCSINPVSVTIVTIAYIVSIVFHVPDTMLNASFTLFFNLEMKCLRNIWEFPCH